VSVTFFVDATTSTPITYQWFYNNTLIQGSNWPSLLITNVQPVHEGSYNVILSNDYGYSLSATSVLRVLQSPIIIQGPQPTTVVQGQTAILTATAVGNPLPLTFRWRRNGATLTNMIVFGTNSVYSIPNADPTNSGTYSLIVTNAAGSALNAGALLTVLADNDHDLLPDVWEVLYGFNTNNVNNALDDPDGDSMNNLQEYLAGTNPTNALSYLKIDSAVLKTTPTPSLVLTLSAVSNHTYTVSYRDTVNAGPWTRFTDVDQRTTNRVVTLTNQLPATVTNRFYRLETPKLP